MDKLIGIGLFACSMTALIMIVAGNDFGFVFLAVPLIFVIKQGLRDK